MGLPTGGPVHFDATRSIFAELEAEVPPTASFGVMLGALNTKSTIDGGHGKLDGDGYGAALFGRSTLGGSGRVKAMVGFR